MVSLPEILPGRKEETAPIGERPVLPETPPGTEGYIEKVEKEAELKSPVTHAGQTLVTSPAAQTPKITLPLTQAQIQLGLHQQVFASLRWLAEWCLRQLKKAARLGIQIVFPSPPQNPT